MFKLVSSLILLGAILATADADYGITVGGGVGLGLPFDGLVDHNTLEDGASEVGWTIRPAIVLGSDSKFAIGVEYTYKYQKYTLKQSFDREVTKDYPWTRYDGTVEHSYYTYSITDYENRTYRSSSHNIGISFTEKLSKNPNWWTVGYETEGNGPFFNANIGVYHGPDDYDANFMVAINTYISTKKIALGVTLNFQAYTSYYSSPVKQYSTYSTTYPSYSYTADTTYNSYYTPDTTTYSYVGSDQVYVRGHFRHYKSGKVGYVRPHYRSRPGRGRR